jgi:hypothetical protein
MGRTVPSFRIPLAIEKKGWEPFRNALDKSEGQNFDGMLTSVAYFLVKEFRTSLGMFNNAVAESRGGLTKFRSHVQSKKLRERAYSKSPFLFLMLSFY